MGATIRKTKGSFDVPDHTMSATADDKNSDGQKASTKCCLAWRHYIACLGFISGMMVNSQRLAVAVAVVDMSNFTSTNSRKLNATQMSCPVTFNSAHDSSKPKTGGDFDWNSELQGLILGAGFLGFALTPILGGKMAEMFGAKRLILWGNVGSALTMLASPAVSWFHAYCMIAVQLLRGIAQGLITPGCYFMLTNWTMQRERGFISSLLFAGYYTGSIVGGLLAGWLCDIPSLGWSSVFYFFGVVGILFSILFALTFYETPRDHPRISETELKYIIEDQQNKKQERLPTPWVRMFTSIPTYALLYGLVGQYWGVMYFLSVHPLYMSTILHYPILENGVVSSLPFVTKIVGSLVVSSISDWLYRRKYVGVDRLRKGCNIIGCLLFTLSMLGVCLVRCDHLLNVVFFTTALFSFGVATPGCLIAAVDMTPNFAASMMGVLSTISCLIVFLLPVVAGILTKHQTLEEWQTLFIINIAIVMSSGIVFSVFGSADVQPWNTAEPKTEAVTKGAPATEVATKEIASTTDAKIEEC